MRDNKAVLIVANPVANRFQIGLLHGEPPSALTPFLAYPPDLWWWSQVWESISLLPTAVVLSAECGSPLQLTLPTDVPQALQAMNAAIAPDTCWLCAPYSARYIELNSDVERPYRRPVAQATDLDRAAAVWIPNIPLNAGDLWWAK